MDAVTVSVPTVAHAELGCGLMEMGIDVLVEKPMASTLAEADRLLDTARRRTNAFCRSGTWSGSTRR